MLSSTDDNSGEGTGRVYPGRFRESLTRELDMATGDLFHFGGERCDRVVAAVLARCRALAAAAACPVSAHGNDSSDK